jgi:hypothetical protein
MSNSENSVFDFPSDFTALKKLDGQVHPRTSLDVEPWLQKMARIPHLRLKLPEFPVAEVVREMYTAEPSYAQCSLRTPEEERDLGPLRQPHWYASALVNYNRTAASFFCKLAKEVATFAEPEFQKKTRERYLGSIRPTNSTPCETALNWGLTSADMDHYPTELWERLPRTTEYITRHIGGPLYRCWFLLLKRQGYLNWHSHARLDAAGNFRYDKFIIHIPIVTNPATRMHVRIDDQVHSLHYKAGEAWAFNSMHNHSAENGGDEDRIHLVITTSTSNPTIAKVIQDSLDA